MQLVFDIVVLAALASVVCSASLLQSLSPPSETALKEVRKRDVSYPQEALSDGDGDGDGTDEQEPNDSGEDSPQNRDDDAAATTAGNAVPVTDSATKDGTGIVTDPPNQETAGEGDPSANAGVEHNETTPAPANGENNTEDQSGTKQDSGTTADSNASDAGSGGNTEGSGAATEGSGDNNEGSGENNEGSGDNNEGSGGENPVTTKKPTSTTAAPSVDIPDIQDRPHQQGDVHMKAYVPTQYDGNVDVPIINCYDAFDYRRKNGIEAFERMLDTYEKSFIFAWLRFLKSPIKYMAASVEYGRCLMGHFTWKVMYLFMKYGNLFPYTDTNNFYKVVLEDHQQLMRKARTAIATLDKYNSKQK